MTSRPSTASRNAACAASEARSGARTRSTSEAISVVTTRRSAGRVARAPAQPQPADDRVADPQLVRRDAGGVGHQRPLVGRRARGDREHGARAVDQHERGVERARGGADDLGQPEPGLDRVGDRGERIEVDRRAPLLGRLGSRAGSLAEAVVVPEHDRARAGAQPHERGEDVDAHHERQQPLAQPPVRPPRGDGDQQRSRRPARSSAAAPTTA